MSPIQIEWLRTIFPRLDRQLEIRQLLDDLEDLQILASELLQGTSALYELLSSDQLKPGHLAAS